jgi:hypothetical protein
MVAALWLGVATLSCRHGATRNRARSAEQACRIHLACTL